VLQLLAEGKSMKEVAYVLSLTARTVAFHKYRIMEALNVKTNAELIQFALKNNLITASDPYTPAKISPTSVPLPCVSNVRRTD
jgi:hypothetical protein